MNDFVLFVELSFFGFEVERLLTVDHLLEFVLEFGYFNENFDLHGFHVGNLIVKSGRDLDIGRAKVRCALLIVAHRI